MAHWFICLLLSLPMSLALANDLSEFGIRSDKKNSKKERFEAAVATNITEALSQRLSKDKFEVIVSVDLKPIQKRRVHNSKNIQLGMLGTIVNLKPPRHLGNKNKFVNRIKSLDIQLYTDSSLSSEKRQALVDYAKQQVSFLPDDVVTAEVKDLIHEKSFSFAFIKDYQVLLAAFFLAIVVLAGMRHMTAQIKAPFQEMSVATTLALNSRTNPNVELLPTAVDTLPFHKLISEDDFFKLPLEIIKPVIGFTTFSSLQEIYTLLMTKNKKVFWSCMQTEHQHLPESDLIKKTIQVQDVEESAAWVQLCAEVHKYIARHPESHHQLHPDIRHNFPNIGAKDDAKVS